MKNLTWIVLVALLASAVHAGPINPTLDISLAKYEPLPAQPGDTLEAWIQVENTGDTAATDVVLTIGSSFPFRPASTTDTTILVGTIAAHTQYVTKVNLAVDRTAQDGTYDLQASVRQSGQSALEAEIPIEVRADSTVFGVTGASTSPAELVPGSRGVITITVQNMEQTLLRDVTASLGLDNTVFVPLEGTNQQKIAVLDGGGETQFRFTVIPQPGAASNVYSLPLDFSYTASDGTRVEQSETIGVVVRAPPQLSLIVDQADVQRDAEGTVLLRLVNKGLSEVKFAEITAQAGEGYTLVGNTPTIYVGNIDSDDFETAEFRIKPSADTFTFAVHYTYSDALNKQYTQDVQLPIMVQPKTGKGPSPLVWVGIAVVVIIGIILWRRSRAKKH